MGNQLCAPWRKGYRDDEHQWTPRKDSHLLRYAHHLITPHSKKGDTKLMAVTLLILNGFSILSDSPVNLQKSIYYRSTDPTASRVRRYTTL